MRLRGLARKDGDGLWRGRRGVVSLEFAFLAPFLFLLFAGALEFAYAYREYEMASIGARDAARYLARVADPTSAQSQTRARNLVLCVDGDADTCTTARVAAWAADPSLVTVTVTKETYDNSAGTFRGPDGGNADIDVIYVIVDITYSGHGNLLQFVGINPPIDFTVVHSERYIGE